MTPEEAAKERKKLDAKERHTCKGGLPSDAYGPALDRCEESNDGVFWVTNDGEYASAVPFCPYCGKRGGVPVEGKRAMIDLFLPKASDSGGGS